MRFYPPRHRTHAEQVSDGRLDARAAAPVAAVGGVEACEVPERPTAAIARATAQLSA